ncbi:MAG: MATE family efflux transporter [Treponemataceae bacterium]
MIYNVAAGILRALGNSKTPFKFLVVTNIMNICLDLLFVAVFQFGVAGAAVATVLSQITSGILIFITLQRTNLPCRIYIKKLKFHKTHLRRIFTLGLPIAIQSILYPISNTVIQASINSFGVNHIAAWAVCGKLDFLVWIISAAFASAISTFVAQNYGAKNLKRARKGVLIGSILTGGLMAIIGFILYVWHVPLSKFVVDDAEVVGILTDIIHLIAPLYLVYCFTDILPGAIQGTGESKLPMLITLTGMCLLRVLWIVLVVPKKTTFMTAMFSYPLSWVVTAFMLLIYYYMRMSKLKRLQLK